MAKQDSCKEFENDPTFKSGEFLGVGSYADVTAKSDMEHNHGAEPEGTHPEPPKTRPYRDFGGTFIHKEGGK
jgi:hypothetical protein